MKKLAKYASSLFFVNLMRLMKVFPNNDPIMGSMLPFARKDKWYHSVMYVFIVMVSFDIITNKIGPWTIGTAVVYSVVALGSKAYMSKTKSISMTKYSTITVVGILFFDIITGPFMTSSIFNTPLIQTSIAQIPFTAMHLVSGLAYTWLLCPILDPEINPKYNLIRILSKLGTGSTQKARN